MSEEKELNHDAHGHTLRIALAGNPNCGKTTVFNGYTGARQHVGNYPGVTVDKKEGHITVKGARVTVVDLPGTYSLTAYSQEEIVARQELAGNNVQAVINIFVVMHLLPVLGVPLPFMSYGGSALMASLITRPS